MAGDTPPSPTAGFDALESTSAPRSFFARANPIRPGDRASFRRVFDIGPTASLRCSFDLRIDPIPTTGEFILFAFEVVGEAHFAVFRLMGNAATELADDIVGAGAAKVGGPPMLLGSWRRLTATLTRTPAPKLTIVDGAEVASVDLSPWTPTAAVAVRGGLVYGHPYSSATERIEVRFDGIRCETF